MYFITCWTLQLSVYIFSSLQVVAFIFQRHLRVKWHDVVVVLKQKSYARGSFRRWRCVNLVKNSTTACTSCSRFVWIFFNQYVNEKVHRVYDEVIFITYTVHTYRLWGVPENGILHEAMSMENISWRYTWQEIAENEKNKRVSSAEK